MCMGLARRLFGGHDRLLERAARQSDLSMLLPQLPRFA